jgi:hypothetical protein
MKEQVSKDHKPEEGLTRRGFIKSVGAGVAAAASGTFSAMAAGAEKEVKAEEMQKLTLKIPIFRY